MIGDFGRDQDDEKALAMAVAMRRLGLIGSLYAVANMAPTSPKPPLYLPYTSPSSPPHLPHISPTSPRYVIANMGDSAMRARLAKGTVSALGANDIRVAKGSRGGERPAKGKGKFAYEFDCPYLADESEIDELPGHELAFAAIEQAPPSPHPRPSRSPRP